jgi:hypothetical protein
MLLLNAAKIHDCDAQVVYREKNNAIQCATRFGSARPVTVLMVADDGTFSGTSEAVFVLGLLQVPRQAPPATVPCEQLYTGILLDQKVVVAISGKLPLLLGYRYKIHSCSFFVNTVQTCNMLRARLLLAVDCWSCKGSTGASRQRDPFTLAMHSAWCRQKDHHSL